jgi:hypothetical protein
MRFLKKLKDKVSFTLDVTANSSENSCLCNSKILHSVSINVRY